ncbi:DNA topology modulation protein [Cohnella sp. AR92]|uniref:DNA topology modulation protein n=1 Tax=Cohnella sp. AR92 TaxID=648716 RepID=UPI000F8D312A|nr:DNA topology modulation protein [Cohnella sp. AR92]RUS45827.1 DNA topology modulation protein [Cohnella sp. AR92]
MNRIAVIGSAGSGKSTLSQRLGELLSLPVVHLDRHYWRPDWVATPNDEWDDFVAVTSRQPRWIMDGNYSRTLHIRIRHADTIVFLDMPTLLCVYRVLKRRVQYSGKTRPDLNEGCPEKLDWAFLKWVWNYKKRSRSKIVEQLEQARGSKRVFILKSRREVRQFIEDMKIKQG